MFPTLDWSQGRAWETEHSKCQHQHTSLQLRLGLWAGILYLQGLVGLSPSVKGLHILPVQLEGFCAVLYCLLVLFQDQMAERSDVERPLQKLSHLWIPTCKIEAAGDDLTR